MRKSLLFGILTVNTLLPAQASLYSVGNVNGSGTELNQTIYDASPSGITSTLLVGGADTSLTDVNVTLNVTGGYNGDLYAYLVAPNGTLVVLLNRVGTGSGNPSQNYFGYSTAGFDNVSLDDSATGGGIHNVANPGSQPPVSYTPDGGSLASFNGVDPNGTWTLFFADQAGGNTSTLNGWSLDITAVPEPVNVALGIFGGLLAVAGLFKANTTKKSTAMPTCI